MIFWKLEIMNSLSHVNNLRKLVDGELDKMTVEVLVSDLNVVEVLGSEEDHEVYVLFKNVASGQVNKGGDVSVGNPVVLVLVNDGGCVDVCVHLESGNQSGVLGAKEHGLKHTLSGLDV